MFHLIRLERVPQDFATLLSATQLLSVLETTKIEIEKRKASSSSVYFGAECKMSFGECEASELFFQRGAGEQLA
jgi:hypothetical protein